MKYIFLAIIVFYSNSLFAKNIDENITNKDTLIFIEESLKLEIFDSLEIRHKIDVWIFLLYPYLYQNDLTYFNTNYFGIKFVIMPDIPKKRNYNGMFYFMFFNFGKHPNCLVRVHNRYMINVFFKRIDDKWRVIEYFVEDELMNTSEYIKLE